MRTILDPTIYSYRVLDDNNHIVATAQIHKYGDVGIVYAIHGKELLRNLGEDFLNGSLKDLNYLEGYVLRGVGKAIEHVVGDRAKIEYRQEYKYSGAGDTVWIRVIKTNV